MIQDKIKILWIDDDIFRIKLRPYVDELSDKGFEIIGVANPDDIEKCIVANADIKCIIIDISMPTGQNINISETKMGMRTGLFVLKNLNKNPNLNSIKKIIFTIVNDDQTHKYCELNKVEYLKKQEYLTDTFLEKIKEIINEKND